MVSRVRRKIRGSATTELALTLPFALLLGIGVVDTLLVASSYAKMIWTVAQLTRTLSTDLGLNFGTGPGDAAGRCNFLNNQYIPAWLDAETHRIGATRFTMRGRAINGGGPYPMVIITSEMSLTCLTCRLLPRSLRTISTTTQLLAESNTLPSCTARNDDGRTSSDVEYGGVKGKTPDGRSTSGGRINE